MTYLVWETLFYLAAAELMVETVLSKIDVDATSVKVDDANVVTADVELLRGHPRYR